MKYSFDIRKWKQFYSGHSKIIMAGLLAGVFCLGFFFHWLFSRAPEPVPAGTTKEVLEKRVKETLWTCSMHPNIQMPKPGKCPICGMDLIPVAAEAKEEVKGLRQISISKAAVELMKVQTTPVERRFVTAEIRMVGKVAYDETRLGYITAWVPGRLDRLFVDYTGVEVKKGDHMIYMYSPELYATQNELITAIKAEQKEKGKGVTYFPEIINLIESARERLRLWGMTPEQIREIEQRDEPSDHMTIYAPMGGIVIEKLRQEGDYVNTGDRIYTVADLNMVWVMLDAYESDLAWLRYGQEIAFTTAAYPGERFLGRIAFIEPILNDRTRTVKVRVNVPNPEGKLKPNMFVHGIVHAQIATGGRIMDAVLAGKWICPMHPEVIEETQGVCRSCGMPLVQAEELGYVAAEDIATSKPLVIPVSAALVTGTRAVVYVEVPGTKLPTFEGREIVLGPRAGNYYLVKTGLKEGEIVVTNANMKIDSAVQIQAKPSMMTPEGGGAAAAHHHGEKAEGTKKGASMHLPTGFFRQLQEIQAAYELVTIAMESRDLTQIQIAFEILGKTLDVVDEKHLTGHTRMLWKEFSMLLHNDVVEGREIGQMKDAQRVYQLLERHMKRVQDQLGIPPAGYISHPPYNLPAYPEFQSQLGKFLEAYLPLQHALANDDFQAAAQSIPPLQSALSKIDADFPTKETHQIWVKRRSNLIMILGVMQHADNIQYLRTAFSLLSQELATLIKSFGVKGFESIYELHSHPPMEAGGHGAIWLQKDKEVRNPYFGQNMPRCVNKIELIFEGKKEEGIVEFPSEFRDQAGNFFESYIQLHQALADDDLNLAIQSVTRIEKALELIDTDLLTGKARQIWIKEHSSIKELLKDMKEAKSLEVLRENFVLLSEKMTWLIRTIGVEGIEYIYEMHCPMVADGRGAIWLQKDKEVRNPYFGQSMLTCADKVKLIFDGKKEEPEGEHQHE